MPVNLGADLRRHGDDFYRCITFFGGFLDSLGSSTDHRKIDFRRTLLTTNPEIRSKAHLNVVYPEYVDKPC